MPPTTSEHHNSRLGMDARVSSQADNIVDPGFRRRTCLHLPLVSPLDLRCVGIQEVRIGDEVFRVQLYEVLAMNEYVVHRDLPMTGAMTMPSDRFTIPSATPSGAYAYGQQQQ